MMDDEIDRVVSALREVLSRRAASCV